MLEGDQAKEVLELLKMMLKELMQTMKRCLMKNMMDQQ